MTIKQPTLRKTSPPRASAAQKAALAKIVTPKTLVTGGTGFLGKHLVRQLVEAGETSIRVMSTSSASAWLTELGVETIVGSVTSPDDVSRAVEGVNQIYHLAGRVSYRSEDARQMYALHVDGTRLLCDAAQAAGVNTIVLASTSGIVAVTETGDSIPDEASPPPPLDIISRWPYYASKLYQERVALERFAGGNRRLVILNPSLLLGPEDDRLSSTKVVLDFLARKISHIPAGGLNFVDVRDAAAAFRQAMHHGKDQERYLLGAANWTFAKLFARLERLTKTSGPRFSIPSKLAIPGARGIDALYRHWKRASPIDPASVELAELFWYFNSAKAVRELGFAARDPTETLYDSVQYVRENFLGSNAF